MQPNSLRKSHHIDTTSVQDSLIDAKGGEDLEIPESEPTQFFTPFLSLHPCVQSSQKKTTEGLSVESDLEIRLPMVFHGRVTFRLPTKIASRRQLRVRTSHATLRRKMAGTDFCPASLG